ncbi:hypothetical protein FACS1894122_03410 [Alphaproteobacteria bacterium]|nr:hypothetical protein FACS1894122_03410 [Alphaproteobacteria bacterium]
MKKLLCAIIVAAVLNLNATMLADNTKNSDVIATSIALSAEIFREVLKVSREPNESEKVATDNLKKLLEDSGVQIDEIRYMDASSLIGGMGFEENKEKKFLGFLNAEKGEDTAYIGKYLYDECSFYDDAIKKRVLGDILEGCKSKTYREVLITLIARTKMSQPFFSSKVKYRRNFSSIQHNHLKFVDLGETSSAYDEISLHDEVPHFYLSLHSNSSITGSLPNGLFSYNPDMIHEISHEAGHSISSSFSYFASESDTMEVISKLVTVTKCEEQIKSWEEYVKKQDVALSEDEKKKFAGSVFPKLQNKYEEEKGKGNQNAFVATLVDYVTSRIGATTYTFHNTAEAFQIMGLGVWKNDVAKVLCINLLSDFAISRELGNLIRFGHLAVLANPSAPPATHNSNNKNCTIKKPLDIVKYSKTNIYDALFPVYHDGIEKYEIKLNSGNVVQGAVML